MIESQACFMPNYIHPRVCGTEDILVYFKEKIKEITLLPWMKAVLDNFLAIFSPFITIIKNINITPCLKAESWFS